MLPFPLLNYPLIGSFILILSCFFFSGTLFWQDLSIIKTPWHLHLFISNYFFISLWWLWLTFNTVFLLGTSHLLNQKTKTILILISNFLLLIDHWYLCCFLSQQECRVCLEVLDQRARGARMGPRVHLVQEGLHLPSAVQDCPVLWATLALRGPLDHQVDSPVALENSPVCGTSYLTVFICAQGSLVRRVSLGTEASPGLARKVLMVNQAHQVSQGTLVQRVHWDSVGIQGHRVLMAREVSSTT